MNIKRLLNNIGYNLHFSSRKRAAYSRRKKLFSETGENVRLPAMLLPLYPKLISFHNNIEIASRVLFVTHDAIHGVINQDGHSHVHLSENMGSIEIMDHVFIGAGTIILPGVKIGPYAIVGAGSVVNKDIPENSVCAGVPAKQIGTYDGYVSRRYRLQNETTVDDCMQREQAESGK